jgi:hypothetical protein
MLSKLHIINGVLVATLIWDTTVHLRTKAKYKQLEEANHDLHTMLRRSNGQVMYLCTLIDKNKVTVDEFDMIMLNDPVV